MWDAMMKKYQGKWRTLAIEQSKTYFSSSADNLKQSAKMYAVRHRGRLHFFSGTKFKDFQSSFLDVFQPRFTVFESAYGTI